MQRPVHGALRRLYHDYVKATDLEKTAIGKRKP
jgi:hypothetical protein